MRRVRILGIALRATGIALLATATLDAAVKTVHVVDRSDVLDGRSFGKSGPYEKIEARAWFTLDPKLPANRLIRDLDLAVTLQADGGLTIATTTTQKMTDFGITPPTAMFGTIKSGDQVRIDVTWHVNNHPPGQK